MELKGIPGLGVEPRSLDSKGQCPTNWTTPDAPPLPGRGAPGIVVISGEFLGLLFADKLGVGQRLALDHPQQRVSEEEGVVAVVEAESHLIQIRR